jgi:homoserine O-succinyltransferase
MGRWGAKRRERPRISNAARCNVDESQKFEPGQSRFVDSSWTVGPGRRTVGSVLDIGLVNNMPDAALQRTGMQFKSLLAEAADHRATVRLHFFSIASVPRGEAAVAAMRDIYRDTTDLGRTKLDALIVTGTEPRARFLPDEPYWPELTRLAEWAKDNVSSVIWSCLAAHAMTQHLDQIERRPLGAKRAGVFETGVTGAHPLLAGLPARIWTPHSRYNDLPEADLVRAGYKVLTRSETAGVDMFAKSFGRSLFVYFQGHPEYGPESLAREYSRDVARFLKGERDAYPALPLNYFSPENIDKCETFEARAKANRTPALVADMPDLGSCESRFFSWRASAVLIYRNWLSELVERAKAREFDPARQMQFR